MAPHPDTEGRSVKKWHKAMSAVVAAVHPEGGDVVIDTGSLEAFVAEIRPGVKEITVTFRIHDQAALAAVYTEE
jgi:glycine cleavage system protein P-like pyridoxal-binding family